MTMSYYQNSSIVILHMTKWNPGVEQRTEKCCIPLHIDDDNNALVSMSVLPNDTGLKLSFQVDCSSEIKANYNISFSNHRFDRTVNYRYEKIFSKSTNAEKHLFDKLSGEYPCLKDLFDSFKYLTITCLFTLTLELEFEIGAPIRINSLVQGMYYERENADYHFLVEDVKIPIHKLILKHASPVFNAMFDQKGMKVMENEQGFYEIKNFNSATIEQVVKLIYEIEIESDDDVDIVLEAYKFVEMYEIKYAYRKIINWIKISISAANFVKIINFAYNHEYKSLRDACMEARNICLSDVSKIVNIFQINPQAFKDFMLKPYCDI